MIRSKLGLKALGLCALVLGLMAISAGGAQAEPTAKWVLVKANGELVSVGVPSDTLLPEVQITEIEELKDEKDPGKHLVLLTEISKRKVALLCSGAELENAAGTAAPKLLLEGSVLGRAVFTGCITKIAGVTQTACKPHSNGSAEGTILTELAKGLIKLHELKPSGLKDATLLLTPENAKGETTETFVTIILGKGGELNECAIGEKLPIGGDLTLWDCQGLFTTEQVTHLIEEFTPLQGLWVLSNTAEHKAVIDGSLIVSLVGEHKGLKWAGIPG